MIAYQDIRDVHLEISTLCNAACPWCPRTFWGYPYNGGYPEINLTLDHAKAIFREDFLQQLTSIRVNGNFGDIVMNPEGADIIEFFKAVNPEINISINTNGGARDREFWQRLAMTGSMVIFALDGLEDTHHLYRQNTVWSTVIKNAKTFIEHGGKAVWQMIVFDHNRHQITDCEALSKELGFHRFDSINSARDTAPVFDRSGRLTHVMGDYQGEREFKVLFDKKRTDDVILDDIIIDRQPSKKVQCQAQQLRSIYIAANGDVSPCCWTGFYPKTYGHGQYHQAANAQLVPMIRNNNALDHSMQDCIEWFSDIERAWRNGSYEQGRLVVCDDNCGFSC
jgi:MoaA/NifB/PqqE/SkfB family radical SAM enzyme